VVNAKKSIQRVFGLLEKILKSRESIISIIDNQNLE